MLTLFLNFLTCSFDHAKKVHLTSILLFSVNHVTVLYYTISMNFTFIDCLLVYLNINSQLHN